MSSPAKPAAVRAGFARVAITPDAGCRLAGYAARTVPSVGVADPLYARALALEGGGQTAILAVADVLALDAEYARAIRSEIARRTGTPIEAIVAAATHTHAGPVVIRTFYNPEEPLDEAYRMFLAESVVRAAVEAWEARRPARIGSGAGRVRGVGVNRRTRDRLPVDEEVGVLRVEGEAGELRGVLFSYACHLTALGAANLRISADLAGAAIARIEAASGGGVAAMFVNGAEGNVSVGGAPLLSAVGGAPERSPERMRELGGRIADAVLEALPTIATEPNARIAVRSARLRVRLRDEPDVETAERALERARAEAGAGPSLAARIEVLNRAIERNNARMIARLGGEEEAELTAIAVGDCALAAAPGELFVETGLALKARAPCRLLIAGLANGYLGYLPHVAAFREGGYETTAARCAPGQAERMAAALLALVEEAVLSFK
jgi:hypothetical protein